MGQRESQYNKVVAAGIRPEAAQRMYPQFRVVGTEFDKHNAPGACQKNFLESIEIAQIVGPVQETILL